MAWHRIGIFSNLFNIIHDIWIFIYIVEKGPWNGGKAIAKWKIAKWKFQLKVYEINCMDFQANVIFMIEDISCITRQEGSFIIQ